MLLWLLRALFWTSKLPALPQPSDLTPWNTGTITNIQSRGCNYQLKPCPYLHLSNPPLNYTLTLTQGSSHNKNQHQFSCGFHSLVTWIDSIQDILTVKSHSNLHLWSYLDSSDISYYSFFWSHSNFLSLHQLSYHLIPFVPFPFTLALLICPPFHASTCNQHHVPLFPHAPISCVDSNLMLPYHSPHCSPISSSTPSP